MILSALGGKSFFCRSHSKKSVRSSERLLLNLDAGASVLPFQAQGTSLARIECDGEVLDRRRSLGHLHIESSKLVGLVLVRNAPLLLFLVDDQRPLIRLRNRKNRIAARRQRFAADGHIRIRNQLRGFVRAGTPDFSVGNQRLLARVAKNLASLSARAGIVHLDRLAIGELALRARRRTLPLRLVLSHTHLRRSQAGDGT